MSRDLSKAPFFCVSDRWFNAYTVDLVYLDDGKVKFANSRGSRYGKHINVDFPTTDEFLSYLQDLMYTATRRAISKPPQ